MNKYRITNPNNKEVRECKSRTTGNNRIINPNNNIVRDYKSRRTESKLSENDNPNRKEYSLTGNNCATFAEDVITQDKSVDKPTSIINTPTNIVDEYQEEGNARVQYNSKTNSTTIGKGNEKDAKIKHND